MIFEAQDYDSSYKFSNKIINYDLESLISFDEILLTNEIIVNIHLQKFT